MTLTETSGTLTTTGSVQAIITDASGIAYRGAHLYLDAMTATETFEIQVLSWDPVDGAYKSYRTVDYSGVQSDPDLYIVFIPSTKYKVNIQRLAGTDRAVNWALEVA